jgi:hypothetical protein
MKDSWISKSLVFIIILLFIGVAVAPSINPGVVTASPQDELVEVTTQACGITGYGDTTVKLTKQQYQDLEQYLIEFRARLNQTTTREEAIPLFKDAVVELDKYGLLPKGMSVERVQRLVTAGHQSHRTNKLVDKLLLINHKSSEDYSNYFCLIYGETTFPVTIGIILKLFRNFCVWRNHDNLFEIQSFGGLLNYLMPRFGIRFWSHSPISFFTVLHFGAIFPDYYGYHDSPSGGYIYSLGSLGKKQYYGSFYGAIPMRPLLLMSPYMIYGTVSYIFYPGIIGFTGLKLDIEAENPWFFVGSAFSINISAEPPTSNRFMN